MMFMDSIPKKVEQKFIDFKANLVLLCFIYLCLIRNLEANCTLLMATLYHYIFSVGLAAEDYLERNC